MTEINSTSKSGFHWPSPLRILAIVAVIFAVCVIVVVFAYKAAWEKMLRLDCQSNLKQIGLLCREYAAEHDGRFPSTWVELNLVKDDANLVRLFRCPSTHHEIGIWTQVDLWSDYRLLPGRTTNNSPETILALEPLGNHESAGANVLFVDGGTQWWSQSHLLGLAKELSTNNATE